MHRRIVVSSYRRIIVSSYHRIVSSYFFHLFLFLFSSLSTYPPIISSVCLAVCLSAFLPFFYSASLPRPCMSSFPPLLHSLVAHHLLYSLFPAPLSLSLVSCSLPSPSPSPSPSHGPCAGPGLEAFSFSHQDFFLSLPTHLPTRCTFITMSSSSLLRLQESFVGPLKIKFRMF